MQHYNSVCNISFQRHGYTNSTLVSGRISALTGVTAINCINRID